VEKCLLGWIISTHLDRQLSLPPTVSLSRSHYNLTPVRIVSWGAKREERIPFYSRIVFVLPVSAFEPCFSVFIPSVFFILDATIKSRLKDKSICDQGYWMAFSRVPDISVVGVFMEVPFFLYYWCSVVNGFLLSFSRLVWALHSTVQRFSFLRCFHLVIGWTFPCPSRCSTEFPTAVIAGEQPSSLHLLRICVTNGD
jgi:hypothetical protein